MTNIAEISEITSNKFYLGKLLTLMNFDYRGTVRTGSNRGVEGMFYEDNFLKMYDEEAKKSTVRNCEMEQRFIHLKNSCPRIHKNFLAIDETF
jgi:hypothetical protein